MVRGDIKNDPVPKNALKPTGSPSITDLRAALTAYNATSYSSTRLDDMTKLDLVNACRVHGLTVAGLT